MLSRKRKSVPTDEEQVTPKIAKRNSRKSFNPESTPSGIGEQSSGKRRSRKSLANQQYTFKSPRPQQFSFPENIIHYISRNPINPKCHQNLIQSCKLLFRMSRILPVQRVQSCRDGSMNVILVNDGMAQKRRSSMTPIRRTPSLKQRQKQQNKEIQINLENQTTLCKFWIYEMLLINKESTPNCASTLMKYVQKCSLQNLSIMNQILTFGELQILTSGGGGKLQSVYFVKNVIKNGDGSFTEFGEVFEALLCEDIEIKFHHQQHGIGKETAEKMAKILESKNETCCIQLTNIPQDFDISLFSNFLKANMVSQKHTIDLDFVNTISENYKNQLQQLVNEIIQIRDIPGHAIPYIQFNGQNNDALNKLYKMRYPHSG